SGCSERLTAIVGDPDICATHVDSLVVIRIDADLAEIHRPRIDVVKLGPGFAFVLGAEHAAIAILDGRVNDIRILTIDVDADSPGIARRQTGRQLPPGSSSVDGLIDAASGTAAIESPAAAAPLISRSKQYLGVRGIHSDIDHSGVFIDGERLLPCQ